MTSEQNKSGLADVLSDNAERILVGVLALALLSALIVGFAYFTLFLGPPLSIEPATLGQAGDYFGGILNPVFGFLSVFALLVALVLQTRELKLSRESLKISQEELKASREEQAKAAEALAAQNSAIQKQSFEQTFFSWLSTYRDVLGDISIGDSTRGRNALLAIWRDNLAADFISPNTIYFGDVNPLVRALNSIGLNSIKNAQIEHYPIIAQAARAKWDLVYREFENDLGGLFRVLYRLIKWIDEQPSSKMRQEDKWLYVGIVRSQLSWIEMAFLYYNGMSDRGGRFKRLIERYSLFDNFSVHTDALLMILKECPMDSFGYFSGAFNSDEARAREFESS